MASTIQLLPTDNLVAKLQGAANGDQFVCKPARYVLPASVAIKANGVSLIGVAGTEFDCHAGPAADASTNFTIYGSNFTMRGFKVLSGQVLARVYGDYFSMLDLVTADELVQAFNLAGGTGALIQSNIFGKTHSCTGYGAADLFKIVGNEFGGARDETTYRTDLKANGTLPLNPLFQSNTVWGGYGPGGLGKGASEWRMCSGAKLLSNIYYDYVRFGQGTLASLTGSFPGTVIQSNKFLGTVCLAANRHLDMEQGGDAEILSNTFVATIASYLAAVSPAWSKLVMTNNVRQMLAPLAKGTAPRQFIWSGGGKTPMFVPVETGTKTILAASATAAPIPPPP